MKLLIGNWKMAPEKSAQAIDLAKKTAAIARVYKKSLALAVAVPFVHLAAVAKAAKTLPLGAQNVSHTIAVASTGLVSAGMLKDSGVTYCIVGHSEARARSDNNDCVRDQVARLVEKKITPILCVGEKERDNHGWYLSLVKDQLESALASIPKTALKNLVIAYEPVWAIGSDAIRQATTHECREMVIFIRKILSDMHGEKAAALVPILYGGSVDETNATLYIKEGNTQGLLIGRVSLEPKRFAALAKSIA